MTAAHGLDKSGWVSWLSLSRPSLARSLASLSLRGWGLSLCIGPHAGPLVGAAASTHARSHRAIRVLRFAACGRHVETIVMAGAADACARRLAVAMQNGAPSGRHSKETQREGDTETETAPAAATEDTDTPAEEPVEQPCAGCSQVKPRDMFSDAQWCPPHTHSLPVFPSLPLSPSPSRVWLNTILRDRVLSHVSCSLTLPCVGQTVRGKRPRLRCRVCIATGVVMCAETTPPPEEDTTGLSLCRSFSVSLSLSLSVYGSVYGSVSFTLSFSLSISAALSFSALCAFPLSHFLFWLCV